ncbi:MAG: hypothetical protein ACRC1W_13275 [Shewanella sp.]
MTEQIVTTAKEYFEQYPKEEVIYMTTDGQIFLSANRHDAQNHQRAMKDGEITAVRRRDVFAEAKVVKLSDEEEAELAELEALRLKQEEEDAAAEEEARVKAEEDDKAKVAFSEEAKPIADVINAKTKKK